MSGIDYAEYFEELKEIPKKDLLAMIVVRLTRIIELLEEKDENL